MPLLVYARYPSKQNHIYYADLFHIKIYSESRSVFACLPARPCVCANASASVCDLLSLFLYFFCFCVFFFSSLHQNEYPTIRDNRVRYVSGFTGSSATIVIVESAAAIWITNPYYAQAEREIDTKTFTIMKTGMDGVPEFRHWLLDTLPKSSRVGIDQYLITSREFHDLNDFLEANGHKLVGLQNLVDVVWKDRPQPILNELEPIEQSLAGMCVRKNQSIFDFIRFFSL